MYKICRKSWEFQRIQPDLKDGFWKPTGSFQEAQVSFLKPPRLHSPIGMKLQKGQALRDVICVATINNIGGESGIDEAGGRVSAAMISNCDLDMSI